MKIRSPSAASRRATAEDPLSRRQPRDSASAAIPTIPDAQRPRFAAVLDLEIMRRPLRSKA